MEIKLTFIVNQVNNLLFYIKSIRLAYPIINRFIAFFGWKKSTAVGSFNCCLRTFFTAGGIIHNNDINDFAFFINVET